MVHSEAELDNRIASFLLRKSEKYPKIFKTQEVNLGTFEVHHINVKMA